MAFRSPFHLTLLCTLLIFMAKSAAAADINTEDFRPGRIQMHEAVSASQMNAPSKRLSRQEKKVNRVEKRLQRLEKMITKRGAPGLSDPDNRYFWYWIGGWGAGLLLTLLAGGAITSGGLAILWFTLFVGGAISLVLWLVKRFG